MSANTKEAMLCKKAGISCCFEKGRILCTELHCGCGEVSVCELEAAKLGQLDTDTRSSLEEAKLKTDYGSSESRQAQKVIKAAKGRFNERSLPIIAAADSALRRAWS